MRGQKAREASIFDLQKKAEKSILPCILYITRDEYITLLSGSSGTTRYSDMIIVKKGPGHAMSHSGYLPDFHFDI